MGTDADKPHLLCIDLHSAIGIKRWVFRCALTFVFGILLHAILNLPGRFRIALIGFNEAGLRIVEDKL